MPILKKCLIDGNYNLIRNIYKIGKDLSTSNGIPTGGVYGFLRTLVKVQRLGSAVVVFDAGHSNHRKELYPDYKKKDKPFERTEEDIKMQEVREFSFEQIELLLPKLGIPTFKMEGEEADDVIYMLAKNLSSQGYEVNVVSDDEDYMQFLTLPKVNVYKAMKDDYWDIEKFKEEYGFDPKFFTLYKSMLGDSSDNIPGAKGIGPVAAKKIINEVNSLSYKDLLKWAKAGDKSIHKKLLDNFPIIKRNMLLVDLNNIPNSIHYEQKVVYKYINAKSEACVDMNFIKEYFDKMEFGEKIRQDIGRVILNK